MMKQFTIFILLFVLYARNIVFAQENFIIDHGDPIIEDQNIGSLTRGNNFFQYYINPTNTTEFNHNQLLINTVNGNVLYQRTDFRANDFGFPIRATFTYNSLSSFKGRYGNKWQFSYNIRYATNNVNKNVILVFGDDKSELFKEVDSVFYPIYGAQGILKRKDNKYEYRRIINNDLIESKSYNYRFHELGNHYVSSISDDFGNEIDFEYEQNRLISVSFPSGKKLSLTYENDLLSKLHFDNIYYVNYDYDLQGNLIEVVQSDGSIYRYEYDDCNLLTKIIYPAGNTINMSYDEKLTINDLTIGSDISYRFSFSDSQRIFRVILPNLSSYQFESDTLYRTVRVIQPNGNYTLMSYNDKFELTAIEHPEESTTRFFYNDSGKLSMSINPLNRQSTYKYDEWSNLIEFTDAENNKWKFNRNNFGLLSSLSIDNKVFNFDFDDSRNLLGFETEHFKLNFEIDVRGNPIRIIFPNQIYYDFRYDDLGYISSFTKPDRVIYMFENSHKGLLSNIAFPNQSSLSLNYLNGILINSLILNDGTKININYDSSLRPTSYKLNSNTEFEIDYKDFDTIEFITPLQSSAMLSYGKNRKLENLLSFNNISYSYSYDKRDNLIGINVGNIQYASMKFNLNNEMTDRTILGNQEYFAYDKLSRVSISSSPIGERRYHYDPFSNLIGYISQSGVEYNLFYNAMNQVMTINRSNKLFASFDYDLLGNLITLIKPGSDFKTYNYNSVGQVVTSTVNNSRVTNYDYSVMGRLSLIDNGLSIVNLAYDKSNRLISINQNEKLYKSYKYNTWGKVSEIMNQDMQKIIFAYNSLGFLSQVNRNGTVHKFVLQPKSLIVNFYDNFSYKYEFNDFFRLSTVVNPTNDELRLYYDDSERLTEIFTDETKFQFDYQISRLINSFTDGDNNRTLFNYSSIGNLISIIGPSLNSTGILYDLMGNIIAYVDSENRQISLHYEHDKIVKILYPGGDSTVNIYNQYGNKIREIDERGFASNYDYNSLGLLSKIHDVNMSKQFFYDNNMKLSKVINELNDTLIITTIDDRISNLKMNGIDIKTLFENGYLKDILLNDSPFIKLSVDNFGFTNSYTFKNGNRINLTNSHIGLVNQKSHSDNSNLLYFSDKMGRIIRANFIDGTSELYSYTNNGLLKSFTDRANSDFSVRYDKSNRPISLIVNRFDSLTFEYNSAGDVIALSEPMGNKFAFVYNDFGSLVTITTPKDYSLEFRYNKQLNEIKMFDLSSDTSTFKLDNYRRIISKNDKLFRNFHYQYDNVGSKSVEMLNFDTLKSNIRDKFYRIQNTKNGVRNIQYSYSNFDLMPSLIIIDGVEYTVSSIQNLFEYKIGNQLQATISMNLKGKPNSLFIPNIGTYLYNYDMNNELVRLSFANSNLINLNFSPIGELNAFEHKSVKFSFLYDTKINVQNIEKGSKKLSYFYDGNSNPIIKDYPTGFDIFFEYDDWNNLKVKFDQSGNIYNFEYSNFGKTKLVTSTSPDVQKTDFDYDKENRLRMFSRQSNYFDYKLLYEYDDFDNLKSITSNNNSIIQISKSRLSEIDTVKFGTNQSIVVFKNKHGLPTKIKYPSNHEVLYEYDYKGRVANIKLFESAIMIKSYKYNYDNLDRLVEVIKDSETLLLELAYNEWSDYTKVVSKDQISYFTYDLSGKLIERNDDGIYEQYQYSTNSNIPHKIGESYIYLNEADNVTSIVDGDNQYGFFYSNENKLIGYSDPHGDFLSIHYNDDGTLRRTIGIDTTNYYDLHFGNDPPKYFAITKNSEKYQIQNVFYKLFNTNELILYNDTNNQSNFLIKDHFGNLLAYIKNGDLINSEYFTYDRVLEGISPSPFYNFRNLLTIPGTELYYDGSDFYHSRFRIYVTRMKPLMNPSPFLPNIKFSDCYLGLSEQFKYFVDSRKIIRSSENYHNLISVLEQGNIQKHLLDSSLSLQFNNFINFKLKTLVDPIVNKNKIEEIDNFVEEMSIKPHNFGHKSTIEIRPEGLDILGDTVFKKSYRKNLFWDFNSVPKYDENRINNILKLMYFLEVADNDQLVRALKVINNLLYVGQYRLPTNIIDISPISIDFKQMDSLINANDYINVIIDSSEPSDVWTESLKQISKAYDFYKNENYENEKSFKFEIDVFSPGFRLYKPHFEIPKEINPIPNILSTYNNASNENLDNLFTKVLRLNQSKLGSKLLYDGRIELPFKFDTLDDINLKNIRPEYQNYFRFLR